MNISFDKNVILKNPVELESEILSLSPDSLDDISSAIPSIIFSKNTIAPFLVDILREPVLNFRMKPLPNFNVKSWDINITDTKGEMFSKIGGKKVLPPRIAWSGRNYKNEMLIPGNWYSYNLVVTDEFDDDYTIQGENFKIKGVFYQQSQYAKIISLSLSDLFDMEKEKDVYSISDSGKKLLKEALDIIKENYTSPMRIVIYDNKEQIALKRAKNILEYIVSNLYIQDIKIDIQFVPSYISDYRVDIQIYSDSKK